MDVQDSQNRIDTEPSSSRSKVTTDDQECAEDVITNDEGRHEREDSDDNSDDGIHITLGEDSGFGRRGSIRNLCTCTCDRVLTFVTVLGTVGGISLHVYGVSDTYWRRNAAGVHFGLWSYCNRTCYTIDTRNNWLFGVQACAVMSVCWASVSGFLHIFGLLRNNRKAYILSLFFILWSVAFMFAVLVLFGYKPLDGYPISRSYGIYASGGIFQVMVIAMTVIRVGFGSTLNMVSCRKKVHKTKHVTCTESNGIEDQEDAALMDACSH